MNNISVYHNLASELDTEVEPNGILDIPDLIDEDGKKLHLRLELVNSECRLGKSVVSCMALESVKRYSSEEKCDEVIRFEFKNDDEYIDLYLVNGTGYVKHDDTSYRNVYVSIYDLDLKHYLEETYELLKLYCIDREYSIHMTEQLIMIV